MNRIYYKQEWSSELLPMIQDMNEKMRKSLDVLRNQCIELAEKGNNIKFHSFRQKDVMTESVYQMKNGKLDYIGDLVFSFDDKKEPGRFTVRYDFIPLNLV